MTLIKQNNLEELIHNVYQTHCILQNNTAKAINLNLTIRNWLIGCHIVEFEQNGKDRAQYGANLLEEIAKQLKEKGVKGLHRRVLSTCRLFYTTYPQIWLTMSAILKNDQQLSVLHTLSESANIRLTMSAEYNKEIVISPDLLLSRLTFSHFIELIRIEDHLQRLFYEAETIKNNWNIRELRRAIDTSLAFRTSISTNKQAIISKIKNLKPENNAEIIRNPYILEFLDLNERSEYNETDYRIINQYKNNYKHVCN